MFRIIAFLPPPPRYLLKNCKLRTLIYFLILGGDNYE
ncbi:hypothetical protein BOM_1296 (plasmid) [Borrelia miyamotoi FR64b]|uniref:Uncharacterized protein n=1 Tax=Borrelia miyamotoi FR64b TaxID=1292392 RepID=W5SFG6_9SPIR|nr:hypothetical protein BOM_1296 [Borrelia miyamotoi FR64b]